MTKEAIENLIGKSSRIVSKTILNLSNTHYSLRSKIRYGKIIRGIDFSDKECRIIFRELKASKMQMLLLEEYLDNLKTTDYYTIEGTQDFLKLWKSGTKKKCCNTCKYLLGDRRNSRQPQPFCSKYQCSLKTLKAKVYRDFCVHYKFNELNKPVVWLTDRAPYNLNKFGEPVLDSRAGLPSLSELEKNDGPANMVGFF